MIKFAYTYFGFILNESLSLTKVISSFFHLDVLHLEVLVFNAKICKNLILDDLTIKFDSERNYDVI